MHAVPVPPVAPSTPRALPALHLAVDQARELAVSPAAVAAAEVNRWIALLAFPFVLSAAFFAAAISTGRLWLIGGALVTGPGLLIMAFIYLGLSSDTNGDQ